jgi:Holliday junction resolvasome RuvABC endonuclease subunit
MTDERWAVGVDPGTRNLGVAYVTFDGSKAEVKTMDAIKEAQERYDSTAPSKIRQRIFWALQLDMCKADHFAPQVLCVEKQMRQTMTGVEAAIECAGHATQSIRAVVNVTPQLLRTHFWPKRNRRVRIKKQQLLSKARELYPHVAIKDQHQADALLLARYAVDAVRAQEAKRAAVGATAGQ